MSTRKSVKLFVFHYINYDVCVSVNVYAIGCRFGYLRRHEGFRKLNEINWSDNVIPKRMKSRNSASTDPLGQGGICGPKSPHLKHNLYHRPGDRCYLWIAVNCIGLWKWYTHRCACSKVKISFLGVALLYNIDSMALPTSTRVLTWRFSSVSCRWGSGACKCLILVVS